MFFVEMPYAFWETLLYAFLNSFPYMVLVLFAFRQRWRCSKRITYFLLAAVTIIMTAGNALRMFLDTPGNPLIDVTFSILYIGFIFLAVRAPVGELAFTVLVLMNLGNLAVVASKCLEGLFFPEEAMIGYHWTYPLMMLPVLCILLPLTYWLIFRIIRLQTAEEDMPERASDATIYMWHFLWLIPGVFYLIWMQHFYTAGQSTLENALDPLNTIYLAVIDLGSILIYRAVLKLVALQEQNQRLQTEKHILSVQNMQYANLRSRMDEIRQAHHDLRHHLLLLHNIRKEGDLAALDQLLESYPALESLEHPLVYCQNETVNAIVAYFADQAEKQGARYTVKLDLPETLFVTKPDLTVLFGNLLENAVEACSHMNAGVFIRITGNLAKPTAANTTLALIIENSYCIEPQRLDDGTFRSLKHKGSGIGIASVRNIVKRYNGACAFQYQDDVFTASVLLNQHS